MTPNLSITCDGKKFMWDGQLYATSEEVSAREDAYRNIGFEVRVLVKEKQFLIYTRRVVKEVVVAPH